MLVGPAVGWSFAAAAQSQTRIWRVGIIDDTSMWDAFRDELRALGYVEGRNVVFEYRYTQGNPDQMANAASELVRLSVDVFATYGTPASRAAKQATTVIPVVMIAVGDPISAGLVTNFARPEGNVTGKSLVSADLVAKRMQLLKEVVPSVQRLAFLWNPDNASNLAQFQELQRSAPAFGIKLVSVEFGSTSDFDHTFGNMMREQPDAIMMTGDLFHHLQVGRIMDFMTRNRLPIMLQTKQDLDVGGLISYGPSINDLFRRGANYVHRIVQGTKPGNLPVEQPVKFELAINLKTAKALGITVPATLLGLADEVIE
jgi:putative ABC transport system substrate-binding protein